MTKRIELAIDKRQIERLDKEQNLWWKLWEEAYESNSPNAKFFLQNYKSCGMKIHNLMVKHNLQPGCSLNWLDKLICCIW